MKQPTSQMQKLLRRWMPKAIRLRSKVSEGTFIPIYSVNGPKFRYQVDLVKDSRFYKKPMLCVHAFKRLKGMNDMLCRSFDYKMAREV
jgi:hypothetical protein